MNSPGLRMTAIRLITLHPADRRWILKRLAPTAAKALRALLGQPDLRRFAIHANDVVDRLPKANSAEVSDSVLVGAAPSVPANASFSTELDLAGRLAPAWAALWLSIHAPECLEEQLAEVNGERAPVMADTLQRFGNGMPAALRHAITTWCGQDSQSAGRLA